MARHLQTTESPRRGVLRPALVVVGLAVAAVGVALNESNVEAGRMLLVAGLAAVVVGVIALFWPRAPAPASAPVSALPVVDAWPEIAALAQRIGLTPEGRAATGSNSGRRVWLSVPPGSQETLARAFLTRQLDMGLSVTVGQIGGDARKRVLSGDPNFDATYTVRADEHKRAAAMVTERLCQHLRQGRVSVNDERVEVTAAADRESAAQALRLAVKVANELERMSGHVPCARPLRGSVDVWLSFASTHHLATASTPLAMWGEVHGMHALAIAVRDAFENFHFEISARFPKPLDRGFSVRPASALTPLDRSGEPLGIPAFDKLFSLHTKDPADTARLLATGVRTQLIKLRDRGLQVRADDERMWAWAGLNLAEPLLVPETLIALAELAAEIYANSEKSKQDKDRKGA